MKYIATTGDSILLKYLHVKSQEKIRIPLTEIVQDFKEIENSSSEVEIYNFIEKDPRNNPQLRNDLEILKRDGFIEYNLENDLKNSYVEITELGIFFAESFRFPPKIEEYLSKQPV